MSPGFSYIESLLGPEEAMSEEACAFSSANQAYAAPPTAASDTNTHDSANDSADTKPSDNDTDKPSEPEEGTASDH